MKKEEMIQSIAQIHNTLAQISVRGDDTLRMADVLRTCRGLVKKLDQEVGDYEDIKKKEQ